MIDGGPLRISRPGGKQVEYRDEPARYQPEEPRRAQAAMRMERQQPRQQRQLEAQYEQPVMRAPKKPRNLSWVKWFTLIVAIAAGSVAGWFMWSLDRSVEETIDSSKYQAVFLSNGQVYFGKLSVVNRDYLKLTNIFYLERQLTTDTNSTTNNDSSSEDNSSSAPPTNDNNFQLLKYSEVLYGSEDAMVISRDDIIRYENLRSDGVVARAIANRN